MQDLGARIRSLRLARSMAQIEYADILGWSRSTLAGIESGADTPSISFLMAVATYEGVTVDWLLSGRQTVALTDRERTLVTAFRGMSEQEQSAVLLLLKR